MTYHPKDRKKNTVLVSAIIVFCIALVFRIVLADTFSSLFHRIATPFWNIRASIAHDAPDVFGFFQSKNSLVAENQSLQSENDTLQVEDEELAAQVSSLSNPQIIALIHAPTLILAKVLAAPPYVPFDTLHLDRGSGAGIALSDRVYIGTNSLIGAISQVGTASATVTLFSSPGYQSSAIVARTGLTVALIGQGNGVLVSSLPKDTDVQVGDILTDSTASQSLMAQVYSVDTSTDGSFKKVLARLPVSVFDQMWVGVGTQ